jgi:predicted secreted protein
MALKIELVDSTGKTNRTIVAEAKPPADRFCPMGYGLVEARIFKRDKTPPVLALVLAVLGPGMEGPERRYIAYVTDLAKPSTVEPAKKSGH